MLSFICKIHTLLSVFLNEGQERLLPSVYSDLFVSTHIQYRQFPGREALNPELLLVKLMEIAGAIFHHPGN